MGIYLIQKKRTPHDAQVTLKVAFAVEHGFVLLGRLLNWTLTTPRGRHLCVAHARPAHVLLSKYD